MRIQMRTIMVVLSVTICMFACDDVSDAELPFRFEPIEQDGPDTRPRAVLSLYTDAKSADSCPIEFRTSLPDETAATTLVEGGGERLFDGDGALVSCRIAEAVEGSGSFDVALDLQHPTLSHFELTGQLASEASGVVRLAAVVDDSRQLEAECETRVDMIVPGAVWLPWLSCDAMVDAEATACKLSGGVIFEYCRRGAQ